MLRFAGFELDRERAELRGADGVPIALRPKTFDLLVELASKPGRVLSKDELMAVVWPNVHVGEHNLVQCIRELRLTLGDEQREMIRALTGRGYRFDAEVIASGSDAMVVPSDDAAAGTSSLLFRLIGRRQIAIAAAAIAFVGVAVVVTFALRPEFIFGRPLPVIAVTPITGAANAR